MADKLQVYKVSCRGGLDTNNDVLTQSAQAPGSAIRLLNYEPSLKGGYQRINGFTHNYGTIEGKGNVLGLVVLDGIGILLAQDVITKVPIQVITLQTMATFYTYRWIIMGLYKHSKQNTYIKR